jgi:hypothetical protein
MDEMSMDEMSARLGLTQAGARPWQAPSARTGQRYSLQISPRVNGQLQLLDDKYYGSTRASAHAPVAQASARGIMGPGSVFAARLPRGIPTRAKTPHGRLGNGARRASSWHRQLGTPSARRRTRPADPERRRGAAGRRKPARRRVLRRGTMAGSRNSLQTTGNRQHPYVSLKAQVHGGPAQGRY